MKQSEYDEAVAIYEANDGIIAHGGSEESLRNSLHVADAARRQGKFKLAETILKHTSTYHGSGTEFIRNALSEIQRRCSRQDATGVVLEVVPFPPGSTGPTQEQQDLDAAMAKAPSLLVKGVNFGKAWAWNAFNGFPRSSEALIKKRLAICQACPSFEDEHCKLCGCRCELKNHLMNKLAMKTAECPLKKW
ncbi:DUF6171 family protein [Schlesneria sp. T3-172]|uniref:DUF6171 family protein n=1 Tax=Schlesneria sphaerica TaxID=3373610 RepID=UPI0037CB870F